MHHPYVQRASRALLIAAIAASTAACATVTRGTKQDFAVQSEPAGAAFKTDHGFSCETPCTMKLPRKTEFEATISKPGYKTATVRVTNGMSSAGTAGMVGNVLIGGILGVGIDAASGATLDLNPNPLVVTLEAEGVMTAATEPAVAPAAEPTVEPAAADVAEPTPVPATESAS
jgi:hypothetical protein